MNLPEYLYETLLSPLTSANRYLYGEDLPLKLVRNKDRSHAIEIHPIVKLYEQAENLFSSLLSGNKYEVFPPIYTLGEGREIFSLQRTKDSRNSPILIMTSLEFIIHIYDPSKSRTLPAPLQIGFIYAFSHDKNGDVYRKLIIPLEDPDRLTGMVKLDSYVVKSSDAVSSCLGIYLSKGKETRLNRSGLFPHPQYHMERILGYLDDTDLDRYVSYLPNVMLDFLYFHTQKVELFPDTFVWLRSGIRISLPL